MSNSEILTSLQNPRIKAIRALSQRKVRQETGLFFAEGIRLVGEAVQTGADIEMLVVSPQLLRSGFGRNTVDRAAVNGVEILNVSANVFQTLSVKDGPQGIAAVIRQRWTTLGDTVMSLDEATALEASSHEAAKNHCLGWVVLENVGNPGNLGSVLRTSDAVGGAGVILIGDTADPYDSASVRGSMGAVFTQRVVRTSLETLIPWKRQVGISMIGASDAATTDYRTANYVPPVILCLGGEQHGLSESHLEACDQVVRIPMSGRADSLNLAVAAGVLLYEVFNQAQGSG